MSEATHIARSESPVTVASLVADLAALGVRAGDVLLVHSGLGRLGWVCGGPQAVIEALYDVLGDDGTLVMPSHAADWSEPGNWGDPPVPEHWWPIIRDQMPAFDPALTPTRGMGRIAEAFRSGRNIWRSSHPQVSMAAAGRHAEAITRCHDLADAFGEQSPLRALYEREARVALIGVGYDCCTALHLAEHRAPGWVPPRKRSGAALRVDGQRIWREYAGFAYQPDDFEALGRAYDGAGHGLARAAVGRADTRLLSMPHLVDFAADWMGRHRQA